VTCDVTRRGILCAAHVFLAADLIGTSALSGAIAEHAKDIDHPDAALLEACAEYHRRLAAACAPGLSDEEGEAVDDAWDAAHERVAAITPHTDEGMRAKAGVAFRALLWKVSGKIGAPWRDQANMHETLAIEVLRDVSGLPEPPPKPVAEANPASRPAVAWVNPDAALLAACAELVRVEAEYGRLCWAEDDCDPRHQTHDGPGTLAAFIKVHEREHELQEQVANTQAMTLLGMRAKAQALLAFYNGTMPEDGTRNGAVLASLLHDLAGGEA
jgi:hypothetical protein